MDFEKIVIEVLSSMGSGTGEARSEELLFKEVLTQHKELLNKQNEIREAISKLVEKQVIVHDEKMKLWIKLKR